MVGPIDVKRKGSASVGYWVQYVTLTFDLTHDLDLGCFKVQFRNSSSSGIVGLIDVKWKRGELIWYWADCMILPFDHTHDLDLGVEISRSEIVLSQDWDLGWVGLWGFLWWAPSAKRKDHHGVSSGWSSVWHCSNTGLSSTQYEQISIILGVWPFWLTPFFFRSITFWLAND